MDHTEKLKKSKLAGKCKKIRLTIFFSSFYKSEEVIIP